MLPPPQWLRADDDLPKKNRKSFIRFFRFFWRVGDQDYAVNQKVIWQAGRKKRGRKSMTLLAFWCGSLLWLTIFAYHHFGAHSHIQLSVNVVYIHTRALWGELVWSCITRYDTTVRLGKTSDICILNVSCIQKARVACHAKIAPSQNQSPRTIFGCQFWSPSHSHKWSARAHATVTNVKKRVYSEDKLVMDG